MNQMYYEGTIRYKKTQETGLLKKVNEKYLILAFSFLEAESKLAGYMALNISDEYDITAIKRLQIAEIFESQNAAADRWFRAKLAYITLDEKTGKERRTPQIVMVHAVDFDDARNAIKKGMQGTLGDWVTITLMETDIVDVID